MEQLRVRNVQAREPLDSVDITQAEALLGEQVGDHVLSDRSYDRDSFFDFILEHGAIPVIPPRKNRKLAREYDTYRYHERALVECFMNKIKRQPFSWFLALCWRAHLVTLKCQQNFIREMPSPAV
jgi:hypothetical protein